MKLHEYQAKSILALAGVPVMEGVLVSGPSELEAAIAKLEGPGPWVAKAQVHAGGRGKAGAVKLARTKPELLAASRQILGMTMVSSQTGPVGVKVRKILLVPGVDIARELYASVLIDRSCGQPVVVACAEGGMEIEELARERPEKILQCHFDAVAGMQPHQARTLAARLLEGAPGQAPAAELASLLLGLARAFLAQDASLVEVNPLVLTAQGHFLALDAKVALDDNALFRHPELAASYDDSEDSPREVEARKAELNYIALDGDIGCMVNGAGLAMATMDLIKLHGGRPNNFLDVGGGASKEGMAKAFRLLLSDPGVKAILVNIFGGIVRCDLVAQSIIEAARELGLSAPLVVRLEGTNSEQGRELLKASGLAITAAQDFDDAARKIVSAAAHA
jgi:succinyl-CoA synthetase beta subunit